MRFAKLAATTIAASFLLSTQARSQFIVSDPATELQSALTAGSTAAILIKSAQTLATTIEMVELLKSSFGVTGLLGALNQGNHYPSSNKLEGQMFDARAPVSNMARNIAQDPTRIVTGTDAEGKLLKGQITGAANAAALAADTLEVMDKRLKNNADTLDQLSRSRNIVQATVTNGLVLKQIHDAIIQNVQATSLLTMATAQGSLHAVEEAATQRRERQDTAKMFNILP
ncbi:MAG: type IV secretion system protein VirB5 [Mesorhizobium sp.]|uniref:type IV secretion system protein VirB5 n=1 Tax=unclassified Mesorhizobium TaxID=325217 RepID=UPI000FDC82E6|nr:MULTISPECIES: type IV secretion system protein VirB5 [unclassified Mesorhizobium]TGV84658.1 type IV secretion system protein VirB5 [Mesorhizobium sp. M00.F.Ca.ET.158.01.1.1]RWD01471.1 MAG: type IV secretion system protein VirB5 [Mesorhizobium sp.]RWE19923.1 MAG: type IV secretion system protein VirB5 [Mesorhizobium sp.]TGQ21279.1 type IV secretion system protein VirB5 [Mesorhizobium sp. M00.F.Ca.ET.217.01.1.1]TKB35345.1 MAG: type IV secretion system protein VirB5 [Mesorhizobium sp.]